MPSTSAARSYNVSMTFDDDLCMRGKVVSWELLVVCCYDAFSEGVFVNGIIIVSMDVSDCVNGRACDGMYLRMTFSTMHWKTCVRDSVAYPHQR